MYSRARCEELLEIIRKNRNNPHKKDASVYYILENFNLFHIGGKDHLIAKGDDVKDEIKYIVANEDLFEILKLCHESTDHGGQKKMTEESSRKYYNITSNAIKLYKSLCEGCARTRTKKGSKNVIVKPIKSTDFGNRGQIDLIDIRSLPDGSFLWILQYQDHTTKFCILRPLRSKEAKGVAVELINIFSILGCPEILQSDNGKEFVAKVIKELKLLWPGLKIVNGRARHPQSQGSVERANGDCTTMLKMWMIDNKSLKWSIGLPFVQLQKNNSLHRTIKMSPYEALFGAPMKIGLASSSLPSDLIENISSEYELRALLNTQV